MRENVMLLLCSRLYPPMLAFHFNNHWRQPLGDGCTQLLFFIQFLFSLFTQRCPILEWPIVKTASLGVVWRVVLNPALPFEGSPLHLCFWLSGIWLNCLPSTHIAYWSSIRHLASWYRDLAAGVPVLLELLSSCSVVLWLGDLNYRLEVLDMELVKKLVETQDFLALFQHDQVRKGA